MVVYEALIAPSTQPTIVWVLHAPTPAQNTQVRPGASDAAVACHGVRMACVLLPASRARAAQAEIRF